MRKLDYDRNRVGAYLGLGAGFAGSTLLFVALGLLLDRKIGTSPVFTLLGVLVGGAAGFYSLVRRAMALQENQEKKRKDDGSSGPSGAAPDEV